MPDVPTVASEPSLLLHAPLAVASLSDVVKPTQTVAVPDIAAGIGLMVTTVVDLQPVDNKYVIVAVPDPAPVTMPFVEPMVATDVLLLAHVPPGVVSFRLSVAATQTGVEPVIAVNG